MKSHQLIAAMNLDEVASNLSEGIKFLKENEIEYAEIRNINQVNILNISLVDSENIATIIRKSGLKVSAIASPLFKWFPSEITPSTHVDNFGVPVNLSTKTKKEYINKILAQAQIFETQYVRIFSGLFSNLEEKGLCNSEEDLLNFALDRTGETGVKLLMENEPICTIRFFDDYIRILEKFNNKNLFSWIDIANLFEIGDDPTYEKIKRISRYIKYLHIKDLKSFSQLEVVPVGEGVIDYKTIFSLIKKEITDRTFYSIENHSVSKKAETSKKSIKFVQILLGD